MVGVNEQPRLEIDFCLYTMDKEENGKAVTKVSDGVVLALYAQGTTNFVKRNKKRKLNERIRNDMVGNKTKGKKMREVFQTRNDVTSASRDIEKCQWMKQAAEQGKKTRKKHKRSIKNDLSTEPPSCSFVQERNACVVTTNDTESGSHSSSSFDDVLSSWVRRLKSRKHKKRDNSMERNNETEESKGTLLSIRSASQEDLVLRLPVNLCLNEDSEVNGNAPDVCPCADRNDVKNQFKKHVLAESILLCQNHEATCTPCLNEKRSIESDSMTEPPSVDFSPERNASAVTAHDLKSGKCASSSFNMVVSSLGGRDKSRNQGRGDNSVDRNKETEKSEGTKSLTSSLLLEKDLLVNSCIKEHSEVNGNASGVCLSRDRSEAEKLCEQHDLAESIEVRQDLEATCSALFSSAGNIYPASESNGECVSEINNTHNYLVETCDDQAVVANSRESDILFTYERRKSINTYSRQRKVVSDSPAVNSESILDTRSLPLVPKREGKPSLVQSVEAPPSFCSKHVHQKEFDEADVRIPSLLEHCASRDEIAHSNAMEPFSQEISLDVTSRKKLLVLDINGLLADVVYHVLEGYTPDAVISGRSVFKRPFCDDFLEFCFARFNVGVWSSRMRRNVELILDFLMGNAKHKLLFCWDQSHCTDSNRTTVENRKKPLLVKKLKKLWEKYETDLPWELGEYNESNTLLLDDSPYKAVCNPPHTAVFPATFRYTDKEDNSLGPGGELRVYLERLAIAENVQKYVEENPIGKRAITERNPSWRFYLDVIRACSSPERSTIRPTSHW